MASGRQKAKCPVLSLNGRGLGVPTVKMKGAATRHPAQHRSRAAWVLPHNCSRDLGTVWRVGDASATMPWVHGAAGCSIRGSGCREMPGGRRGRQLEPGSPVAPAQNPPPAPVSPGGKAQAACRLPPELPGPLSPSVAAPAPQAHACSPAWDHLPTVSTRISRREHHGWPGHPLTRQPEPAPHSPLHSALRSLLTTVCRGCSYSSTSLFRQGCGTHRRAWPPVPSQRPPDVPDA